MQRERVSDNVYWFQSDIYAQVTAGVIVGPQWSVLIDTLAMPEETLAMRSFIEDDLRAPVRYIINTHSHADHSWGNCFFSRCNDYQPCQLPHSYAGRRSPCAGNNPKNIIQP